MNELVTRHGPDRREVADCRLLAGLFRFLAGYFLAGPSAEAETLFSDPEWRDGLAASGMVASSDLEAEPAPPEAHRREYERLFRVPDAGFVPPFEQAYRETKATVDASAVGECQRVYSSAGYEVAPYSGVEADHVGHQTRFVAAILEREAGCLEEGDEDAATTVATWRTGFLSGHGWWWTSFAERVAHRRPCRQVRIAVALLASLADQGGTG